jgi:hypothetical protein
MLSCVALSVTAACSADTDVDDATATIDTDPPVDETGDELASNMWFATDDTAICPSGSNFDDKSGFCVTGGRALGPFTEAMISACKQAGRADCDSANWSLADAVALRGTDTCPKGSSIDPKLGLCVEGEFAFGPFDSGVIAECVAAGGGSSCSSLRISKTLVKALPDGVAASLETKGGLGLLAEQCSRVNARMMRYYSTRAGYSEVSRLGMRTLGTRRNGCAAWLSHALRQSGVDMPVEVNTERFRDALLARGWRRITNRADLAPGDVIISRDRRGWAGHPDHVYMFAGWEDAGMTVPLAVDNQGFTHPRYRGKSPIAYGLRAPDNANCTNSPSPEPDPRPTEPDADPDSCANRADGWYCSVKDFKNAVLCQGRQIASGWRCSDNSMCRPDGQGRASMYGNIPGCYGSR